MFKIWVFDVKTATKNLGSKIELWNDPQATPFSAWPWWCLGWIGRHLGCRDTSNVPNHAIF